MRPSQHVSQHIHRGAYEGLLRRALPRARSPSTHELLQGGIPAGAQDGEVRYPDHPHWLCVDHWSLVQCPQAKDYGEGGKYILSPIYDGVVHRQRMSRRIIPNATITGPRHASRRLFIAMRGEYHSSIASSRMVGQNRSHQMLQ